jgi:N-carbamoylputrescine amidase
MTSKAIASVRQAAAGGAKVVCLQELFNGPYFCQVQESEWYDWAEPVPDGPTIRQMRDVAREAGTVLIVPVYEVEHPGVFYNTAAVIDSDGS